MGLEIFRTPKKYDDKGKEIKEDQYVNIDVLISNLRHITHPNRDFSSITNPRLVDNDGCTRT